MAGRLIFLLFLLFEIVLPSDGAIRLTDDTGRVLAMEVPSRRIVSLYAGHSENLLALGARDRLVGVSAADDPALFPGLPRLPARVDAEGILALSPDLVLIRPQGEAVMGGVIAALERAGVTVASLTPPTWDSMEGYLSRLGELGGIKNPEALWRDRVAALEKTIPKGSRPRVFLESSARGLLTCSPDSWAAKVIALAGGDNAAKKALPLRAGSPLASWGEERVLALAQEGIDVYLVQTGAMNPLSEEEVRARPWISGLGDGKIVLAPEEWVSRPSLLRLEEGVERLRILFHGEGGVRP